MSSVPGLRGESSALFWFDRSRGTLNRYESLTFARRALRRLLHADNTMAYTVSTTTLPGVLVLEPQVFEDSRGAFFESFSDRAFTEATGLTRRFVQDGHSISGPRVMRGLHYQVVRPQGKLVRVVRGSIFDVAVDLRRSSPTFRQWVGVELSAANRRQVWVPEGFGHGFVVTSDGAEVHYKTTEVWTPAHDRGVRWDDPTLAVAWPIVGVPVLSEKDAAAPRLEDAELYD